MKHCNTNKHVCQQNHCNTNIALLQQASLVCTVALIKQNNKSDMAVLNHKIIVYVMEQLFFQ